MQFFMERLYSALLILYPADYRREYGDPMMQIFRDVSREKYLREGIIGVAFWWCATLLDLIFTVIEQRRKVEPTVSKSTFTQFTGIFLIVSGVCGAISAFSQFQPDDHNTYHGIYQILMLMLIPSLIFLGLGCIGLGLRIGRALGRPGQWTLYLSSVGALVMAVGIVAMSIDSSPRNIWFVGGILYTTALTAFGLLHLRTPVLPIFRALPLQIAAGWWILLLNLPSLFPPPASNLLAFLMFFGSGLAWLAIGMTLNRQAKEKVLTATAA